MHSEHFPTDEAGSAAKLNPDVGWGLGGGPGPRGSGWIGGLLGLGTMLRGDTVVLRARRFSSLVGRAGSMPLPPCHMQRRRGGAGSPLLWVVGITGRSGSNEK